MEALAADLHRLADKLRDTGWQPFQVRDEINMGIRRVADRMLEVERENAGHGDRR